MQMRIILYFLISVSGFIYAQETPAGNSNLAEDKPGKDLLLLVADYTRAPVFNLQDQMLILNGTEDKNKTDQKQVELAKPQSESFSINSGVLYFLGAAAIAAVIYFLVPDNEPSSKAAYTFGIPVTPK
jgi:hypothetical protein